MYKIAMVAPTPFFSDRGCHVRIFEEIKILKKLGENPFLCTYHLGEDVPGVEIHRIPSIPWYKKLTAGPSLHKFYIDLFLLIKFSGLCLKKKPDIIHAFLHEGAFIGEVFNLVKKTPVVFDMQGGLTDELGAHSFIKGNKSILGFFRFVERYIDRKTSALLVCSGVLKDILVEEFHVPPENIFIVPDGVDLDFFKPPADKLEIRRRFNLPLDKKIIVYLGLLTRYQGVDIFLKVIKSIKDKYKDIHFLIMGYPNVEYYIKMARDLGIDDIITFTGRLPYKYAPDFLGLADIAVSPKLSKTESNGKLLNYMAVGLPVVVFDTPVNREILGAEGIYAEFGDAEDFTEKLEDLLADTTKAESLGKKLLKRAQEEFSWDMIGKRILDVYERIV